MRESIRTIPVNLLNAVLRVVVFFGGALLLVGALNFPYSYDRPLSDNELAEARKFYADAYRKETTKRTAEQEIYQSRYEMLAAEAARGLQIERRMAAFVDRYGLKNSRILDIGSGRGHLQNIVQNYTGLDISPSVAPLYRKPFVVGSATALPFADNSFDAAWSILVLEHIPEPERMLVETRRVLRDGGIFYLLAAWNAPSWLAEGYQVRPYSDFDIDGKLIKASLAVRDTEPYYVLATLAPRLLRLPAMLLGPTTLRYTRLTPNYKIYWRTDSDAVVSVDSFEALLWFLSRGDECLNCDGRLLRLPIVDTPLVIKIKKTP